MNLSAYKYQNNGTGNFVSSSYQINGSGSRDGHGGRGLEHKRMMEEIANEVFDKKIQSVVSEIQKAAYTVAYAEFTKNLAFDVDAAVDVAFGNAENIFHDQKTQKVVASHIMHEIEAQMRKMSSNL